MVMVAYFPQPRSRPPAEMPRFQ